MPSLTTTLTEALKAEVQAAPCRRPFACRPSYLPRMAVADMEPGRLYVLLVPRLIDTRLVGRRRPQHVARFDLAMTAKLPQPPLGSGPEADPAVDPALDELVDDCATMARHLLGRTLAGYPAAITDVDTDEAGIDAYDEALAGQRVFLRVLTLTLVVDPPE